MDTLRGDRDLELELDYDQQHEGGTWGECEDVKSLEDSEQEDDKGHQTGEDVGSRGGSRALDAAASRISDIARDAGAGTGGLASR
jgi:hypothetical protein